MDQNQLTQGPIDEAHHADNQRRFMTLETKIEDNSRVTEKVAVDVAALKKDTAELVEMWKDAGVFFRWMRRFGSVLIWFGKVAVACGVVWGAWRYGTGGGK